MNDDVQPINFSKHADGRVTVDRFPTKIAVDGAFLDRADPAVVRRTDDGIEITVANGSATYKADHYSVMDISTVYVFDQGSLIED